MAFRIVKDAAAWWPMTWNEAADDGAVVEASIELRFVRMGEAEFQTTFGPGNTTTNDQLWARVVRGWRGVQDEDGVELTMTDEAVAAFLDTANVPAALGTAYIAFFRAIAETRLGNSSPPPAGGPAAVAPTGAPEATPPA